jgi:hypothetical protein
MADVLLDNQAVPTTPAAGKTLVAVNSSTKQLVTRDDSGRFSTLSGSIRNWNTADVVANAADTYLTGSGIVIPTGQVMQVGTVFRWRLAMTKTAAGVAAPVWVVRVGTAGTTADTARLTFTQVAAQTAAVDTGMVEIFAILRNVGAAGILTGCLHMAHVLAATGFSTLDHNVMQVTSAGFDTTVAGTIVGVSVNPGAAGVWTHQVISAECLGV